MSLITYEDLRTDAYSQYDAGDNLQTLTQSFSGGQSVTFSYGWLKNHQRQSTAVSDSAFQYIPFTGTTNYAAADVDNGYTSAGGTNFTYDGNHNLIADGFNTLTYDVENRLIQAQNGPSGQSQYFYDPLGHRKQKQSNGVTTQFVLAGDEEIADFTGTGVGTPQLLTVRGVGGLPVAEVTPAAGGGAETVEYYHHDVLGSSVAATSTGQNGAEAFTYGEFGVPGAGYLFTYGFAGYRYDTETGLHYARARYYSPELGRFLQSDPIGLKAGTNLYAYVGNDPLNRSDPTGLSSDLAANSGNGQQQGQAFNEIRSASSTSSVPGMILGGLVGELIEPAGGGVLGAVLESTIGIGVAVSNVPSTGSTYLTPQKNSWVDSGSGSLASE